MQKRNNAVKRNVVTWNAKHTLKESEKTHLNPRIENKVIIDNIYTYTYLYTNIYIYTYIYNTLPI